MFHKNDFKNDQQSYIFPFSPIGALKSVIPEIRADAKGSGVVLSKRFNQMLRLALNFENLAVESHKLRMPESMNNLSDVFAFVGSFSWKICINNRFKSSGEFF